MVRTARTLLALLLVLAVVAACQSSGASVDPTPMTSPAAPVEEPDVEPTTADGIYTEAQADRGLALYEAVCSECHDTADWTETSFKNRWEGESVYQLWYYVFERMPYENPFSLTRQQVTDMLSYIFELNGLPAGAAELQTDDDSIDDFWIAWDAPQRP